VNAPRFITSGTDELDIEKTGISPDTIKLLQARGHKIKTETFWSDGECIAVDANTGELLGAPDGRNGERRSDTDAARNVESRLYQAAAASGLLDAMVRGGGRRWKSSRPAATLTITIKTT